MKRNKAIKAKKQSHCIWNGRPEDPPNELVVNKTLTTQQLRKICRMEIARRRINEREQLIGARTMDNALFHKLLHQQRGKLNRLIDELNVGDTVYRSENILCGWREHFAELAKESVQETFDQNYLNATKFEYEQIIKICQHEFSHEDVTIEELDKAILKLNRGKSGDIFGVTAECILYGGDKLKNLLLKLINLTFEHYSVPDLLKVGTLTLIYKNKGLMTESKNYRGITITPTLSKIIETILKFRINRNILSVQNPLQRGFTENSTPLMASLIL